MTAFTLVCHTEGCPNEGIEIVLEPVEGDSFDSAICGGCGQPITGLAVYTPSPDDGEATT